MSVQAQEEQLKKADCPMYAGAMNPGIFPVMDSNGASIVVIIASRESASLIQSVTSGFDSCSLGARLPVSHFGYMFVQLDLRYS